MESIKFHQEIIWKNVDSLKECFDAIIARLKLSKKQYEQNKAQNEQNNQHLQKEGRRKLKQLKLWW